MPEGSGHHVLRTLWSCCGEARLGEAQAISWTLRTVLGTSQLQTSATSVLRDPLQAMLTSLVDGETLLRVVSYVKCP